MDLIKVLLKKKKEILISSRFGPIHEFNQFVSLQNTANQKKKQIEASFFFYYVQSKTVFVK